MHLISQRQVTLYVVLSASLPHPSLRPMLYGWKLFLTIIWLAAFAIQPARAVPPADSPNPEQLVRDTVQNALRGNTNPIRWRYRELIHKDGRLETREVFQTSAGTIDRLIAIDNQPLSPEQQRKENARLQALLVDSGEVHRERLKQREDAAKQMRMFATFPHAFHYEYAGTEGGLVKLKFEPRADFVPSSRQEEVFHHLEGTMWIDPEQKHLARIDGTLISEVRFGGGLLGRLDKGGVFSVRFRQLESDQWVMAALHVEMDGRALLFKTISVQERRDFDQYQRLPDNFTLLQAAELLDKDATSFRETAANNPKQE